MLQSSHNYEYIFIQMNRDCDFIYLDVLHRIIQVSFRQYKNLMSHQYPHPI